jgi:AsmA protein
MRIGKILALSVGALIALSVIALLAVWLLVNPNDYKPRIAAAVKDATGRDLVLQGDIKLSVFPWIALELGQASLGNPPGFSDQPFLAFSHAAVRVRLLPLLAKRLEVGRVEIDGLDLKLLKNAAGKGNWEGFGRTGAQAPAPDQKPAKGEALQGLAGIKISNARVSYQQITLQNLNLETGAFAAKGEVPVTLRMDANRGVAGEHASLDARFDFSADPSAERYALAALNLNGMITLAGNARAVSCSVTAPAVELNLAAQTLAAAAVALNMAGAQVTGSVQGTRIIDAPTLTGTVTLAPLVVREFLPRLGLTVPATRDPKAWSRVAASGGFTVGSNAARIDPLQATVDDTHLTGSVAVNRETHAVAFELTVDTIDLDRYRPPAAAAATPPLGPQQPAKADSSTPLDANGTLAVGALHFAPLDLSNVKLTIAAKDKVWRIFPLKAQVDGGQYSGDIMLDDRGSTLAVSLDEHLSGIDVGKLLAKESKKLRVTGRGNVNVKVTGHGAGEEAILKSLEGHFDTNVGDGAVEGIDLGYELGRAEALLRRQDLPAVQNTKRTTFDALKLSAEITKGVAATKDLLISSAALKVTGQGTANLPTGALDFALLADTMKTAGNVPIQIPVRITGTFSDPTVRPDVEALAKGELKQKVKDVLQDKLKGLFGKP